MAIPIDAAVRCRTTGKLGRRVKAASHLQRRACILVQFDGEMSPRTVRMDSLHYVARRYSTAKQWAEREQEKGEINKV
jgi:hypothetical protein